MKETIKRTYIKNLKPTEEVLVAGYIETIRNQKNMIFLVLTDATGSAQITIIKSEYPTLVEIVEKLTTNSFIEVIGKCVSAVNVKLNGIEIYPSNINVLSIAETSPISQNSAQDLRLDYRWIDLRNEKKLFYFKIQTAFEKYAWEYFTKNGYISIHTPKITALSSEGGSEVFELKDYFGQKAYLTQSPQLYKQMSMMAGFDRTFEIGEYFRANPSFTSRHDTEFTGIDVEISYIHSHHDVMDAEEGLLKYILKNLKEEFGQEFKKILNIEVPQIENPIPRIKLYEVYEILKTHKNYEVPRELKGDLDPQGERLICEYVKEKYGSDFVFITDFPTSARAFYTMKNEENPEICNSYDLLFKGLEITAGAQREHSYEKLKKRIIENGIKPENMKEYLEFFKYGAPTHGGFAIGITRTLTSLFELPGVKEVTFLFRGPKRLFP